MTDIASERDLEGALPQFLGPKAVGYNLDPINVHAGIAMLRSIGYTDGHTQMVIEIALARWGRGEEPQAERLAIDQYDAADRHGYGVDFTSWRMILAAAMAGAA